MEQQNHMQVVFDAKSENEGLARMLVTAFMSEMNPTLSRSQMLRLRCPKQLPMQSYKDMKMRWKAYA